MLPNVNGEWKKKTAVICTDEPTEKKNYVLFFEQKLMILYFVFYRIKAEELYCATKRWTKNGSAKIRREQNVLEN